MIADIVATNLAITAASPPQTAVTSVRALLTKLENQLRAIFELRARMVGVFRGDGALEQSFEARFISFESFLNVTHFHS